MGHKPKKRTGKCDMSLTDLVRGFMDYAASKGVKSFPPFGAAQWHEFLYESKEALASAHPILDCIGNFDWDGPYPRCCNLNDAEFGLRFSCAARPFDGRIVLRPGTRLMQNILTARYPGLAQELFERAGRINGFFEH